MDPPSSPFWKNVERFRASGLDPLRWIAGCSVEVDEDLVLYPALSHARGALEELGVTVGSREGPAVVEDRGHPLGVKRVIVGPAAEAPPYLAVRGNARSASVLSRVDRPTGDDPEAFSAGLVQAIRAVPEAARRLGHPGRWDRPLVIGSLEAHATARPGAQFCAFDFLETGRGPARGRFLVKSQAVEVTDASLEPMDPLHVQGALAAALAPLVALGCSKDLRAWPVLDAPSGGERATLRASFQAAAARVGVRVEEAPGPDTGSLFIGATVSGAVDHDPPQRHQDVAVGMEVSLTRAFGDLAPLLVYLMAQTEDALMERAKRAGHTVGGLRELTRETHRALTTPDLAVARAVAAGRPPFGEPVDSSRHLAATVDLSLEGVVALIRFAVRRGLELRLDEVPLAFPELARFATTEYLTDNATANAPGAVALVGYPTALDTVEGRLAQAGLHPIRVGVVTGTEGGRLVATRELATFIGSKRLLANTHLA